MKEKFSPAGANELQDVADEEGNLAGFWKGMWHGFIAPFIFIGSLFRDDLGIYETHNNGRWYNFGFILGLMMVFGGNRGAGMKMSGPKAQNGEPAKE